MTVLVSLRNKNFGNSRKAHLFALCYSSAQGNYLISRYLKPNGMYCTPRAIHPYAYKDTGLDTERCPLGCRYKIIRWKANGFWRHPLDVPSVAIHSSSGENSSLPTASGVMLSTPLCGSSVHMWIMEWWDQLWACTFLTAGAYPWATQWHPASHGLACKWDLALCWYGFMLRWRVILATQYNAWGTAGRMYGTRKVIVINLWSLTCV